MPFGGMSDLRLACSSRQSHISAHRREQCGPRHIPTKTIYSCIVTAHQLHSFGIEKTSQHSPLVEVSSYKHTDTIGTSEINGEPTMLLDRPFQTRVLGAAAYIEVLSDNHVSRYLHRTDGQVSSQRFAQRREGHIGNDCNFDHGQQR